MSSPDNDSALAESTLLGRRVPSSEMPMAAVAIRWFVGLSGLLLLPAILLARPPITFRYFIVFAAMMIISELLLTVRVSAGSYYSVSTTFLFVYFIMAGGVAAATLDAAAFMAIWFVERFRRESRETPLFAMFVIGQHVLASLIAAAAVGLIFSAPSFAFPVTSHPRSSVIVFGIAYLLVTAIVKTVAVWTRAGFTEVRWQLWPSVVSWDAISIATCVPFAIVVTMLAASVRWAAATVIILLFLSGISLILRLNVNLRQGNDELKAINRIGTLLSATLDLNQLFSIVAKESSKVLPWDAFFIALAEKDSPTIQIIFMTKGGSEITQRTIPRTAGLTGRAISTGELIIYNRESDSDLNEDDTLRGQRRPRSIAVAPMKFGDAIMGAISVQSFHSYAYDKSQTGVLQTIAAQAAIAIRNAQLFKSEQQARIERDEFFSLVTHEIKNPLTSVKGYAEIAGMEIDGGNSVPAKEALEVIQSESRRILRLVEDLLDASKMGAGKFSVRFEEVDLANVVTQIAQKYAGTARHDFDLRVEPPVPTIEGDSIRLSQVIDNLISNAVKYSPDGTKIHVAVWSDSKGVYASVADSGVGISPEKIPLILERFYRVDEAGSDVKGTGLGLFVSREIIRMHGGEIDVESAPNRGSIFTVRLPRNRPPDRK